MLCEEDLPELSKELVQQNLRKYIKISLLVFGAYFEEELLESVSQGLYLILLFF